MDKDIQGFWDHLEVLRRVIFRIFLCSLLFGVMAFILKPQLFAIVLAPQSDTFITYRLLDSLATSLGAESPLPVEINLINTGLTGQFLIHTKTALCAGVILASPYALYMILSFITPALYRHEKRLTLRMVTSGYVMFTGGVLLSYFIIFPLTFRFLGTYHVTAEVANMITLDSYISTLALMCILTGIVCELPVIVWLLARAGLITSSHLKKYRRHTVVAILIAAAVITPSSDIFTLMLVFIPVWLLYEASVLALCIKEARYSASRHVNIESVH